MWLKRTAASFCKSLKFFIGFQDYNSREWSFELLERDTFFF